MNKARVAEAARGIIQKSTLHYLKKSCRFEHLDRVLNSDRVELSTRATFGKDRSLDGTKDCKLQLLLVSVCECVCNKKRPEL